MSHLLLLSTKFKSSQFSQCPRYLGFYIYTYTTYIHMYTYVLPFSFVTCAKQDFLLNYKQSYPSLPSGHVSVGRPQPLPCLLKLLPLEMGSWLVLSCPKSKLSKNDFLILSHTIRKYTFTILNMLQFKTFTAVPSCILVFITLILCVCFFSYSISHIIK